MEQANKQQQWSYQALKSMRMASRIEGQQNIERGPDTQGDPNALRLSVKESCWE